MLEFFRRSFAPFQVATAVACFGAAAPARAQTCSPTVTLTPVTGLSPITDIRHAKTPRLYLLEQSGRVRIHEAGTTLPTPFLDITSLVASGGERGLLSIAFHPNYPATPWFFVLYTSQATGGANLGDVRVARYSVSSNPNVADPASARVLITVPHNLAGNHNGGQLQFGPSDGLLYVSIGDGGVACDTSGPGCNAQRNNTFLGKMLRLDINSDVAPFYTVPPSNPFVGPGDPLDEIWAKGLRNPFRFSFDRANGDLWIGDVGQGSREEIDFQPSSAPGGRNYGWKIMEGNLCNTCSTTECPVPVAPCADPSLTLPIHDYDRTVGGSIIGGYVYRGSVTTLRGCYVFGDFVSGRIWAIDPALPSARRTLVASLPQIFTFGEDSSGELYVAAPSGVFRFAIQGLPVPASPSWGLALLSIFLVGSAFLRRRMQRQLA